MVHIYILWLNILNVTIDLIKFGTFVTTSYSFKYKEQEVFTYIHWLAGNEEENYQINVINTWKMFFSDLAEGNNNPHPLCFTDIQIYFFFSLLFATNSACWIYLHMNAHSVGKGLRFWHQKRYGFHL